VSDYENDRIRLPDVVAELARLVQGYGRQKAAAKQSASNQGRRGTLAASGSRSRCQHQCLDRQLKRGATRALWLPSKDASGVPGQA